MESIIKGVFKVKWQPQLQFVRYKNKINITRPRPPHFERALVEKICLPYFNIKKKPKNIPDFESCVGPPVFTQKIDQDHPLLVILAEKNFNHFNKSNLIAFFHFNSLTPEEKFEAQLLIKKNGMKLIFPSKIPLKKALIGTPFECTLSLFDAPTAIAISPEPALHTLMSIHRKIPKMNLMSAIVENRLLCLTDLINYGIFKDITDARLHLVSIINSASQYLMQQVNSHPNNLVGLLNQHKKLLEDKKS